MKKIGIAIIKALIGIITAILILIIVLNILLILSEKVLKDPLPSIMDYTYVTIDNNDQVLGLNKGDLLLLDTRKTFANNDIIYYKTDNSYKLGKIVEINGNDVKINTIESTTTTTRGSVLGTKIASIPYIGNIIKILLQPISLIVAIIILIITSIIQNLIAKKTKGENQEKPDFSKMKRYN